MNRLITGSATPGGSNAWTLVNDVGEPVKAFFVLPLGGETLAAEVTMLLGPRLLEEELQQVHDELVRLYPDREIAWAGHCVRHQPS